MPRGNLETIDPLALTVSMIDRLLSQFKYSEAFTIMRRNRINLNLLYDYNPKEWKAHIHDFVSQINNQEYLNLFINDLTYVTFALTLFPSPFVVPLPFLCEFGSFAVRCTAALRTSRLTFFSNDDFTKSEYFNPWEKPKQFAQSNASGPSGPGPNANVLTQIDLPFLQELTAVSHDQSKSNVICDALYNYLNKNGVTQKNYLSLLTSLVKYNPPKVEEALSLVQQLKGKGRRIDEDGEGKWQRYKEEQ